MSNVEKLMSPYEKRVALVQKVVTTETNLKEKAAFNLAVQMLRAVDEIPEQMR